MGMMGDGLIDHHQLLKTDDGSIETLVKVALGRPT